ncbi:carboxypeptidase-like regulatory domain-containing protein [Maribacter sp. 2308TA10-17]|uniref:carboxypeptidase-like regulatory domain-containing protein n=1 Tax=Maribacter sp. 2308TA10-17 TaxID=3386276 RepID=UPI0039BD9290
MSRKFFGLCFSLLAFGASLSGQSDEFIRGFVIDKKNNEPVVFATIQIKNRAVGVISNQDGSFRFPKKLDRLGDSLLISCLGYQNKAVSIDELSLITTNRILLAPSLLELNEAVVLGKRNREPSPRQIIRRAIKYIPDNYPLQPFATVGYYRDYQLKNNEYTNLNEAIVKVFDQGFENNDLASTKVKLYDYVRNTDFPRDSIASKPYDYANRSKIIQNAYLDSFGGNEFSILRMHDAIRNFSVKTFSFVNRFNKDLLKNHSFSKERDVSFNGEQMFVLNLEKGRLRIPAFTGEVLNSAFSAKGKIYISQTNYAIHKFMYELYDHNSDRKGKYLKKGKLVFEVSVEYRAEDDKMFPNYISFHNIFQVRIAKLKVESIDFDLESKRFVIKFNKPPTFLSAKEKGNYLMEYKGKKVKIKELRPVGNEVYLYPNSISFKTINEELTEIYQENGQLPYGLIHFSFVDIADEMGNVINQFEYKNVNQFREFFVQRVQSNSKSPRDSLYLNKTRPIFKNQPVVKPKNLDEFWMNTPLKKINKKTASN